MEKKYAVLAVVPGQEGTQFVIVHAPDPMMALQSAAQSLIDAGSSEAQLVAVFEADDLRSVLAQLEA